MTAALEGCEWSAARPGRTLPPGKTRYPFYRRLGEPQGRSGRRENLVPTEIRSRTVQPVAQSLYRLRYPAHSSLKRCCEKWVKDGHCIHKPDWEDASYTTWGSVHSFILLSVRNNMRILIVILGVAARAFLQPSETEPCLRWLVACLSQ